MGIYQYHIFSPYRVCPLGAHVDHQHGLVTGFAIDKGVDLYFDVRSKMADGRCDPHVHLESRTFEGTVDFDIDKPSQVKEHHWGDYARGAKYALRKRFELKRYHRCDTRFTACGWLVFICCCVDCLCDGFCKGE